MSPNLTPEDLRAILQRLDEVEGEARALRAQIEQRLAEYRRADAPDRSGQPNTRTRKRKTR